MEEVPLSTEITCKLNTPLVSIFIPAYNNPEYTQKTLQSIRRQRYRPIEIILSDDCSPISLLPLANNFKEDADSGIFLNYIRHSHNLTGADNVIYAYGECTGKYCVYLPHDDWWIDEDFIGDSVNLMEQNKSCFMCVGNSSLEVNLESQMVKYSHYGVEDGKIAVLNGDEYIRKLGPDGIGWQAWSAVVFNLRVARSVGALHFPYNFTKAQAEKFGVISDEFFALQFLMASMGGVGVINRSVSVRGLPKTSFCATELNFSRVMGEAAFVIFYNIYSLPLTGPYSVAVKKRALEMINFYPVRRINFKILSHYAFNLKMLITYLKSLSYTYSIRKIARYIGNRLGSLH